MHVQALKTRLIKKGDNWQEILVESIPSLAERSIVVVTSKLLSTCEDRFVPIKEGTREEKQALAQQEADWYLDPHSSKYDIMLTIKGNCMFMNAGLDESNADGQYLLWPRDPQASANAIWHFLREHYGVKEVGVTISDSTSFPLNWGVVGHAIAHCGFNPLRSYIGKPDLFGRLLKMEQLSVMHSVTIAAVLEMGEGNEQTPLGIVTDVKNIEFRNHPPTAEELAQLRIELADDAFAPVLTAAKWKKGGA